ncbi:MAG: glycosyltransferase family 1 protein [Burkholderiaceae bacterium]|nr:MAG: glycosyltransferase family 1 protein [Burkholderiaceae bacterium]
MLLSEKSIAWLISNLRTNDFGELFSTELASTRMRAGVCISGCKNVGLNVLSPNYREPFHDPDIVFMAKFVPDSNTGQYLDDSGVRRQIWLDKINKLKSKNKVLLLDYTDNHFSKEGIVGDFYREIKPAVSGLILPSEKMKKNIDREWDGFTKVIPEPVEVDFLEPDRQKPDYSEMTALWFGHNSNLGFLMKYIATSIHNNPPRRLIILTNNMPTQVVRQGATLAPKGLEIKLGQWSLDNMRKAAKVSHYALIPSEKNNPRKSGVSPGRLLTSMALGLPVIAEPLDSYLPFKEFFAFTDSDRAKELAKDPKIYHGKVKEVQGIIRRSYTVSAIEEEWVKVVRECL